MAAGFAPAKINLCLHVLGRRPDGYHLLDSVVAFAEIGDTVAVARATDWSLEIAGPMAAALADAPAADNLVLRAARAYAAATGTGPVRLTLEKHLPVASGIGGGSADAAATLRLLQALHGGTADLAALGLRLGADVPVCLAGVPSRMSGIGEALAPLPALPPAGIVLLNPGVPVATGAVFAARAGAFSAPLAPPAAWPDAAALAGWLTTVGNDLEAPACRLAPAIGDALAALRQAPGCLLARMSGSGATCFGLFPSSLAARQAAAALARPGWWCWGGGWLPSPDRVSADLPLSGATSTETPTEHAVA